MKDTFAPIYNVADKTFPDVMDIICTGARDVGHMNPDDWLINITMQNVHGGHLLDFGCGVGRNAFGFALTNRYQVAGYDNESMVSRASQFAHEKYPGARWRDLMFFHDWTLARWAGPYSAIVASLCLQHISPAALTAYLRDFRSMTDKVIVAGRRANDFGPMNTWRLLEQAGFPTPTCYEWLTTKQRDYTPDGDPNEHMTCVYRLP